MSDYDVVDWGGGISYGGHFLGCGFCGASVRCVEGQDTDFPDCCDKMREWKARLANVIAGPAPLPEPEPHEIARWRRVQQRWQTKHAEAA